ncbi:Odorant receptor [Temnothorax longispinosus]|uniref:Odorant receptor n=1 Tax=Temnothorax longispinosus TaxID=300112 RepID=A0A4S2JQ83_9HYME|nr:Odorant receptor [Temnothorax longispinosus]
MSFFDNRYYYLNKRFLSVIGQWPFQSRLEGNMMFAVTSLFIFSLTAFEVFKDTYNRYTGYFWGLAAGITDLSIIMENTSPLLVNSFVIMKLINCFVLYVLPHMRLIGSFCDCIPNDFFELQMKELLEDIEETWKMKHASPEKEILQHYAEESRTFTIRYAIALYVTWLFYSTTPVVISGIYKFLPTNETYTARFLYRLEHVLDMDKYFNLLMLHGFISVFYIVSVVIAVDCTFTLCTQHICALFECIRYDIERIRNSNFILPEPNIEDDEAYHDIIGCIKSYKHALKSCKYPYRILRCLRHYIIMVLLVSTLTALEFWGLLAGITDLSIILDNVPPLLMNSFFAINQINLLLPANKTYSVRFLYRMEHVLDMDKYNNLLMLHSFFTVFYIISVLVATDCLFILCTQHACALFKCVKYNVERVQGSDLMLLNPNITDDEAYHALINCIKLYKRALKFSDLISSTYATCFLFTLGDVVICLSVDAAKLQLRLVQDFTEIQAPPEIHINADYQTVPNRTWCLQI